MKSVRAERSPSTLTPEIPAHALPSGPFPASRRSFRISLRLSYLFELAALLVVAAFCERELLKVVALPLEPDSMGYRENVAAMTHLFDTDIREPIWIWSVWLFEKIWGSNDSSLRLGSMYTFLITDCLVYLLALFTTRSRLVAIGAFLIFGTNPFLVYLALSGNRENMVMCSMTGLSVFSLFTEFPKRRSARICGQAVFSVLAVGSRLSNLPGVIFLLAYSAVRKYIRPRDLLVPALAVAIAVGPYLYYSKKNFNDAFVASNVHSRWFRNYEFCYVKKTGCPGCSCDTYFNEEHKVVDSYGGARVTTFQYVFGMHPPGELVRLVKLGLSVILFSEGAYFEQTSGFHYNTIWPVYFLGLACLLACRRRIVLLVPLVAINMVFFTVNMMPGRIFTILSPFLALAIAFGATMVLAAAVYALSFIIRPLRAIQPLSRETWR